MTVSFLERTGGRLAYEVSGPAQAPLAVLAHGMGDTRATYRFLAPRLVDAGYRVAALDVRGHGDSSSHWPAYGARLAGEDLLALVQRLGGPAVVVANSATCASGVWAAAEAPAEVAAL